MGTTLESSPARTRITNLNVARAARRAFSGAVMTADTPQNGDPGSTEDNAASTADGAEQQHVSVPSLQTPKYRFAQQFDAIMMLIDIR